MLGVDLVCARAPVDAGVVDPGAQRAGGLGRVRRALVRRPVADVPRDGARLAAEARERALQRLGVPVHAHDVVAVGREPLRDCEPDPHRGARDDRARRACHGSSCGWTRRSYWRRASGRAGRDGYARRPVLLYDNPISSNALKVRFLLAELGLGYDRREVPLTHPRPGWYLAENPLGGVPALDDGGLVMAESNAILRYLAQRRGGPTSTPPTRPGARSSTSSSTASRSRSVRPSSRSSARRSASCRATGSAARKAMRRPREGCRDRRTVALLEPRLHGCGQRNHLGTFTSAGS